MNKTWFIGYLGLLLLAGGVSSSVAAEEGAGAELYTRGLTVFKVDPEASISLFAKAAKLGDTQSMVVLGHCYRTGTGVKPSRKAAIQWYEQAVDAGDLSSLYELGQLYGFADPKKRILPDYAKAIEYYEKAVDQGSLEACAELASIYASGPDSEFHDGERAIKYGEVLVRKNPKEAAGFDLLAAAHARNVDFDLAVKIAMQSAAISALDLVEMRRERIEGYKKGRPFPATASDSWIFNAAEQNSVWAMETLARMHEDQNGRMHDLVSARLWHTRAVEKGSRESLVRLGVLCRRGQGGPVDMPMAYRYFKTAAEDGIEAAYAPLGRMYVGGQGSEVNFKLAQEWYAKAAGTGTRAVALEYTMLRRAGDSMEYESGEQLFERAEKQKGIRFKPDGKPLSVSDWSGKIFMYYWLAAEKGHTGAMQEVASIFYLGRDYFVTKGGPELKGVNIRVDYRRALDWYEQLAHKGIVLSELQECRDLCDAGIYTRKIIPK